MEFFVSTSLQRKNGNETWAEYLLRHGFNSLELSGGKWYSSIRDELNRITGSARVQFHNFLPLNPEELVINLASGDREIRFHSANHLRELIQLTAQTGGRWFSFHAGFSADPVPDSLGRRWVLMNKPLPLSDAYERYWEEVARLAQFARESGVSLLIENNILTAENLDAIGPDVLLLANPEDILMHSEALPTGVSLLIDVAHLEVSARVFRSDESRKVLNSPAVRAYHFSNTNGDFDTGEVLTGKEAFWAHIHGGSAYATLEIRSNDVSTLQAQLRLVEQLMTK